MLAYRNNPQDDESGGRIPAARPSARIATPAVCVKPGASPTRVELVRDIEHTIEHWRLAALTPREIWHQLTGQTRQHVTWRQVKDFMVGWQTDHDTKHMDGTTERRMD